MRKIKIILRFLFFSTGITCNIFWNIEYGVHFIKILIGVCVLPAFILSIIDLYKSFVLNFKDC